MRKSQKSFMYKMFNPIDNNIELKNYICVVGEGYLLHRVLWTSNQTFGYICGTYASYVKEHYGEKSIIVFDGYEKVLRTKNVERLKRSITKCSTEIIFNETM